MDFKVLTSVFVVLTMALGASTGYLLVAPGTHTTVTVGPTLTVTIGTYTQTSTVVTGVTSPYTVNIAYKPGIGFYLTNGTGFTIYYRTSDIQSNGTSTCTGGCVQAWPVFYSSKLVLPPGLDASSFKTVTRADGMLQLTFNGWPLYHFADDKAAGNIFGQGVGGVWFAYTITASASTTTASTSTTSATSSTTTTSSTSTTTTSTSPTITTTTTTTTTSSSHSGYGY